MPRTHEFTPALPRLSPSSLSWNTALVTYIHFTDPVICRGRHTPPRFVITCPTTSAGSTSADSTQLDAREPLIVRLNQNYAIKPAEQPDCRFWGCTKPRITPTQGDPAASHVWLATGWPRPVSKRRVRPSPPRGQNGNMSACMTPWSNRINWRIFDNFLADFNMRKRPLCSLLLLFGVVGLCAAPFASAGVRTLDGEWR